MNSRAKGLIGETAAAEYYRKSGYSIICTNWRYKKVGEIDIIAKKDGITVFSEVKLRKNTVYGAACAAVNREKQGRIRRLAQIYLSQTKNLVDSFVRFDVVEVYTDGVSLPKVEVLENAF